MIGPRLRVVGDQRTASALLGIPVRAGDGSGRHSPDCAWCDGTADQDTCPQSVRRRAMFAPHPPTCRRCRQTLGECPGHTDGATS